MYCGRVQQAVVGRVVLLTFIPEKKQPFGVIIKFYGALSMSKSYWIKVSMNLMLAYKIFTFFGDENTETYWLIICC